LPIAGFPLGLSGAQAAEAFLGLAIAGGAFAGGLASWLVCRLPSRFSSGLEAGAFEVGGLGGTLRAAFPVRGAWTFGARAVAAEGGTVSAGGEFLRRGTRRRGLLAT